MFTVKLEVNGKVIRRIDAVRQSERAFGINRYVVKVNGTTIPQTVMHRYEDGPIFLAQTLCELVLSIGEDPGLGV